MDIRSKMMKEHYQKVLRRIRLMVGVKDVIRILEHLAEKHGIYDYENMSYPDLHEEIKKLELDGEDAYLRDTILDKILDIDTAITFDE